MYGRYESKWGIIWYNINLIEMFIISEASDQPIFNENIVDYPQGPPVCHSQQFPSLTL